MESEVDRLARWERTVRDAIQYGPGDRLERLADELLQLWARAVRNEADEQPAEGYSIRFPPPGDVPVPALGDP